MKIGYISFRLAGYDGVSLEADRWREILERMGHTVVYIAGELDGKGGELIPELHFKADLNDPEGLQKIVEEKLDRVVAELGVDKLIVANIWSLPLNIPAALAIEKVVKARGIPTISRNHDWWWERPALGEFPVLPIRGESIKQVTINSIARRELLTRTGEDSAVIGDCFDYEKTWEGNNEYLSHFRADMGLTDGDIIFVQATRIVPRKKIERAIELVEKLQDPKVVLLIVGQAGDEGNSYGEKVKNLAVSSSARVKVVSDKITSHRGVVEGRRTYTLWDCLAAGDWMTFPSESEGFGNQFLEGIYFRKPIVINRYEVFKADLEPLGFETVNINGGVTPEAVERVRQLMSDPVKTLEMTEKNFRIAAENFSFKATGDKLKQLGF